MPHILLTLAGAVAAAGPETHIVDTLPPPPSVIPSHKIAVWLLGHIDRALNWVGLAHNRTAEEIVYVTLIALVALGVGVVTRWVLLSLTRISVHRRNSAAGRELLKEHTFRKCTHIIPPLVFMALIPFAFNRSSDVLDAILRFSGIYLLMAFAVGLNAVLTFIFNRYNQRDNTRNLPLKGILNVGKGLVWIVVCIVCCSILIDKSPAGILTALGAFAAALMLIFKDSILGFVAGIQMAENDMIHVGDWIVVPGTPANGTVLDMSLTTVKVQNWDNTIITVPPYTLVSGAFQNWRGMSESGVRRIMQTFTVDYAGFGPLTPELLENVEKKYPEVLPYTTAIRNGEPGDGKWMINGGLRLVNGTLETNLGLFRVYLCAYLCANPHISNTHRVLVQLIETNADGFQLQIWCWTNTTDWNAYESIQSAVMEHVVAVAPDFGLVIYASSSETIDLVKEPSPGAAPSEPAGGQAANAGGAAASAK